MDRNLGASMISTMVALLIALTGISMFQQFHAGTLIQSEQANEIIRLSSYAKNLIDQEYLVKGHLMDDHEVKINEREYLVEVVRGSQKRIEQSDPIQEVLFTSHNREVMRFKLDRIRDQ